MTRRDLPARRWASRPLALFATGAAVAGVLALGALQSRGLVPTPGELAAATVIEDASLVLEAVRGTPDVACALVERSLGNRWGSEGLAGPRLPAATGLGPPADAAYRQAVSDDWGSSDVDSLVRGLADSDACVRRIAAKLLGEMRDGGATEDVLTVLDTGGGPARTAALRALAYMGDDRAMTSLVARLEGGTPGERSLAAWALGVSEPPGALSALIVALADPEADVRAHAAWAVGEFEDRQGLRPLTALLDDAHVSVRINAALALGTLEDADAIPALTRVLGSDGDPAVRRAAAIALGRIE